MRSLYACLVVTALLAFCETASAQRAFTISPPPTAVNPAHSLPSAEEKLLSHQPTPSQQQLMHRRMSSQQQLIFQRAARAAKQREARIESRRRWGVSAARPNMVFNQPVVEWYGYGRWWMPHTVTYYSRVR